MAIRTTSYKAVGGKIVPTKGRKMMEMGTFKWNIPKNCRRNEHDDHARYRVGCSLTFGWCIMCAHRKGENVVSMDFPKLGTHKVKVCDEHLAELQKERDYDGQAQTA